MTIALDTSRHNYRVHVSGWQGRFSTLEGAARSALTLASRDKDCFVQAATGQRWEKPELWAVVAGADALLAE